MSNRFGWSTRGALSPFSSNLGPNGGGVPAVTDDDFSYITSEDLETHGVDMPRRRHHDVHDSTSSHYGKSAPPPQVPEDDDILLIKNKGVTYPEHFPAYSIGDGQVLVRDLQERIQLVMKLSDRRARRVRLLYKGRQLKDMDKPIRDYGVKNNSEVLVVLGDVAEEGSSEESSEEIVVVDRGDDDDARKKSSKKKRRGKKRDSARSPPDSGSNNGLEVPLAKDRRGGSSSRAESPSGLSGVSGASAAAAVPGGPLEKLNSIGMHFTTKLLPLCLKFTAEPPSDAKKREDEHRRISETVMQQVILKLDEVDTQGDDEARARRRELVRHVQSVLKEMDGRLNG
ncbi:BAG domain-containing protein [Coniochaeta sp. 2T2.1]|nr:BAG domain-containing protein [Coniochaeta sp. 2T2.1]